MVLSSCLSLAGGNIPFGPVGTKSVKGVWQSRSSVIAPQSARHSTISFTKFSWPTVAVALAKNSLMASTAALRSKPTNEPTNKPKPPASSLAVATNSTLLATCSSNICSSSTISVRVTGMRWHYADLPHPDW